MWSLLPEEIIRLKPEPCFGGLDFCAWDCQESTGTAQWKPSETLIFLLGTICVVTVQVAISGQLQILHLNRNMGQGDGLVKREIALAQSRKQCRWEWSAEGNALAKEQMKSLANLSGYQKPSLLGSFRPLDSITRQKWQLSNGSWPVSSRQTGMHHNSADLFHLQSHNTQAGGPSSSSWQWVCQPPTEQRVFWNL